MAGFVVQGSVYLDYLTWDGTPNVRLGKPAKFGKMWSLAWTNGVDDWWAWWPFGLRLMQNEGTGLLIQGTREWADYQVSARVTPHLSASAGIGARVQGMRRYYGLLLRPGGKVCLVKALDGEKMLAEAHDRLGVRRKPRSATGGRRAADRGLGGRQAPVRSGRYGSAAARRCGGGHPGIRDDGVRRRVREAGRLISPDRVQREMKEVTRPRKVG